MKRHAVIDPNGVMVNIILWDGASPWMPPEGHIAVDVENIQCDIGWTYSNGVFTAPPETQEPDAPAQA